jgi:hypothetical protein
MAHRVRSDSVRTGHPVGLAINLKPKRGPHLDGPHSRAMTALLLVETANKKGGQGRPFFIWFCTD